MIRKHWVQDSVEIENPFRYRGYFVGKKPIFDIQNNSFDCIDHGKVVSIEESSISDTQTVGYMSAVTFEDGAITTIQNCAGYITSGHWEAEK
ncbi:hypothetical protein LCA12A_0930 [Lacticaseibacillus casei 12A]|uniref:hypothetical protein n=1 Tax=Lacticaseibacillus paracasei TaxID=1597 RepID=UPI0002982ED5|nr:hypothetical protein [Lacticaseibacillus paracasei]EKP98151.1 hypothetical protein LCA12A_0930 [Lacticaseibacillus casei 12A]